VLEDLVSASHASVESISRGMMRVQDVAEQVQQMANRATLIAIHVVTGTRRDEAHGDDVAAELKLLARDVRETNERTAQFALEVETAVADATTRMREARERALARLEPPAAAAAPDPAPAPAALARAHDDVQRLFERVREMVQDAARKGERLSLAGERASRAAERLARRIDEEAAESEALAVRLSPASPVPAVPIVTGGLRLFGGTSEAPGELEEETDLPRPGEERP
jgi:methyl-accepting chemotaxis protein